MTTIDKRRILIVDDDLPVAQMMQALLASEGHAVSHAKDGVEGLEAVARELPDLILLDLDMPRLNGFEVCRQLKSDPYSRLVPIVILTGRDEADLRTRLWNLGADEFLSKPCQAVEVLSRCRSLLRIKGLIDDLDSAEEVVLTLARAVEAKSAYTQGHTERVTDYALVLAGRIGIPVTDLHTLRRGAALHDIGKIAIPDEILNKPGKLTTEEFDIVKKHPVVGAHIVEKLNSVRDTIPLIRWHHERIDGSGYPDGLSGDAIPILTQVLAVADVFDALSSARPYRPAIPLSECLALLKDNAANGGLDPELVGVFCEHISEMTDLEKPAVELPDTEPGKV